MTLWILKKNKNDIDINEEEHNEDMEQIDENENEEDDEDDNEEKEELEEENEVIDEENEDIEKEIEMTEKEKMEIKKNIRNLQKDNIKEGEELIVYENKNKNNNDISDEQKHFQNLIKNLKFYHKLLYIKLKLLIIY